MPWLQAHITTDKDRVSDIEAGLQAAGALSISLLDAEDQPMLEPAPGHTPLWRRTEVTALFDIQADTDALRQQLVQLLQVDDRHTLRLERLEDQAWERAWLEHFKPMRFGQKLWICPTGHHIDADDAVVVDLDPGLAFGTGTHPTTRLCLEWLDAHPPVNKTVIDFGCGSGILALAALKLGARQVIAIDHDPQALLATCDNAERNQVADRLITVDNEAFQPMKADLVLANILANVLIELRSSLIPLLKPGADLVLSGILDHQFRQVQQAYSGPICFAPPLFQQEWTLLTGQLS